jgi:hypothetical protein
MMYVPAGMPTPSTRCPIAIAPTLTDAFSSVAAPLAVSAVNVATPPSNVSSVDRSRA